MDYRMLPFKGLYWYGNWPADRLKRHIYPVPDPRNPFLGVHLTVTVNGRAKNRSDRHPLTVARGLRSGFRIQRQGIRWGSPVISPVFSEQGARRAGVDPDRITEILTEVFGESGKGTCPECFTA